MTTVRHAEHWAPAAALQTMERWPSLPLSEWEPTYKTLHRWTQIVGKIRLALCSSINHFWHTSLRFDARGLTTTLMPVDDVRQLEITFDFLHHRLVFRMTDGTQATLVLEPRSVADFYAEVMDTLQRLGVGVHLWPVPVEVADPVPFHEDTENASYDRGCVERMWRILLSAHEVFTRFRGRFVGKCSPVHFFWGAFDLAVTRFSGRRNPSPPEHPVMGPAYSHEVISHGFWFGGDWPTGGRFEDPMFYAYAVPTPSGFSEAKVRPEPAHWSTTLGEFILPYASVRHAFDADRQILEFAQSTYAAGAEAAGWDRAALEAR